MWGMVILSRFFVRPRKAPLRERGAVLIETGVVVALLILFVSGAYEILNLATSRYISRHAFSSLLTAYKQEPGAVDLDTIRENVGMGWLQFDDTTADGGSCIVVTSHATEAEARSAADAHDCSIQSVTSYDKDKPYYAVSVKHKQKISLLSFLGEKSYKQSNVVYVNLHECEDGQALVGDGSGGILCTDDIEQLYQEIESLESEVPRLLGEIQELEKISDENYRDILERIRQAGLNLAAVDKAIQNFKRQTQQNINQLNNQINNLSRRLSGIENTIAVHRRTIANHANAIANLWAAISNLHRQLDALTAPPVPYFWDGRSLLVGWHGALDTTGKGGYTSHNQILGMRIARARDYRRCYMMAVNNSQDGKNGDDHSACVCDIANLSGYWTISGRWNKCKGYCRFGCEF